VRVVGGELRGRRIEAPRGGAVRPTADRVREAIFSILGDVSGTRVLDLFCGTGALAVEALSRGATTATLVDRRTSAARRNVRSLGLNDRCSIVRDDALRFLGRGRATFDLVFCDPPYKLADRLEAQLDQLVGDRLAEDGRLIVETSIRRPLALGLPLLTERRYGDTLVRVHGGRA
jgi:16S rRNA (guanine966-N2)-methyltransferase